MAKQLEDTKYLDRFSRRLSLLDWALSMALSLNSIALLWKKGPLPPMSLQQERTIIEQPRAIRGVAARVMIKQNPVDAWQDEQWLRGPWPVLLGQLRIARPSLGRG